MCVRRAIGIDTVRKMMLYEQSDHREHGKLMTKSHLKLVAPTTENRTVTMPTTEAER